jgi:hypothetical protein
MLLELAFTFFPIYLSELSYHLVIVKLLNTPRSSQYSLIIKSKAVPLHAMEAHGGRGGVAPTHT